MDFTSPKISLEKSWKFTPQVLFLIILGIFVNLVFSISIWYSLKSILPPSPQSELVEITATSETYKNPDGTYTAKFYATQKYYKENPNDPNEPWKEIDTTIVPSIREGYDWEMTNALYKMYFKNDPTSENAIRIEQGPSFLVYQAKGFRWLTDTEEGELSSFNYAAPSIDKNIITWPGAPELKITLRNNETKEEWKIKDKNSLPSISEDKISDSLLVIEFILNLSSDLKILVNEKLWNGEKLTLAGSEFLTLRDSQENIFANINLPIIIDQGGKMPNNLTNGTYIISKHGEDIILQLGIEGHFLAEAKYPILIDPIISPGGGGNTLRPRSINWCHMHGAINVCHPSATVIPETMAGFNYNYDVMPWPAPTQAGQFFNWNPEPAPGKAQYFNSRSYVAFDTSSIDPGATINDVDINFDTIFDVGGQTITWIGKGFTLNVRKHDWGGSVGWSDWIDFELNRGDKPIVGSRFFATGSSPPGSFSIDINNSVILKGGTTKIAIASDREEDNRDPTSMGSQPLHYGGDGDMELISFQIPSLTVNYSPSAPPPPLGDCDTLLNPPIIDEGETARFTWNALDAVSCNMWGDDGWTSFPFNSGDHDTVPVLSAGTYHFGGSCTGSGGENIPCPTRTLTINSPAVPSMTVSWNCNPATWELRANLSWDSAGAGEQYRVNVYDQWSFLRWSADTFNTSITTGTLFPEFSYRFEIALLSTGWTWVETGLQQSPPCAPPAPTLSVNLTVDPSSGDAPLNDIDLTADISGTASGTINYTFYCDRSDDGTNITPGWAAKFDGVFDDPKTAIDVCDYSSPGIYTAKVIAERESLADEDRETITVTAPPIPDFSIFISPDRDIDAGESTTYDVIVNSIGNFEGDVTIYASVYDSQDDEGNDKNNNYGWACWGNSGVCDEAGGKLCLCNCNKADVMRDGRVTIGDVLFLHSYPAPTSCAVEYPDENSVGRYNCNRADANHDGTVNSLDSDFIGTYMGQTCSQLKDISLEFSPGPETAITVPAGGSASATLTISSSETTPGGTLYVRATGVHTDTELDNGPERTASALLNITAAPNNPPSAINLSVEEGNYCTATAPPIFLKWVFTDPDAFDFQSAYQVQVDNNSNFSSPEVDTGKVISNSKTYPPPNLTYNTTYYWRLMVWDDKGDPSTDWIVGPSFTTASPPPDPSFECSLDTTPRDWKSNCNELGAIIGETVYFKNFNPQTGPAYGTYQWEFFDSDNNLLEAKSDQEVDYIFLEDEEYTVKHTVIDDGVSCDTSKPINISEVLPEWREIPPT